MSSEIGTSRAEEGSTGDGPGEDGPGEDGPAGEPPATGSFIASVFEAFEQSLLARDDPEVITAWEDAKAHRQARDSAACFRFMDHVQRGG